MGVLDRYASEIDQALKEMPGEVPVGEYVGIVESSKETKLTSGLEFVETKIRVGDGAYKGVILNLNSFFHTPGATAMSVRQLRAAGFTANNAKEIKEAFLAFPGRIVEFKVADGNDGRKNLYISNCVGKADSAAPVAGDIPTGSLIDDEDLPF